MGIPLLEDSNTVTLYNWVLEHEGATFADKCNNAMGSLHAGKIEAGLGTKEWSQLNQRMSEIGDFLRYDRNPPLKLPAIKSLRARAA